MTATLNHPDVVREDRAYALTEGSLIDVSPIARRFGFRHPVAVTAEVWEDCIHWDEDIEATKTGYSAQETDGRLRDVVWMAYVAARAATGRRAHFTIRRVPVEGKGTQARPVTLVMDIGPGDDFEPVITIKMPGESA